MRTLLLLIIASVAASDEDVYSPSCRDIAFHECGENSNPPDEFPGTEEEYEEFCKFAVNFFECVGTAADQCQDDKEDESEALNAMEMLSTMNRVCDKDTLLYSAIVDNLPCFKKNLQNIASHLGFSEERQIAFAESLAGIELNDVVPDDAEPSRCLFALYEMSHMAVGAGTACGDVAKDVVIDIFQGFDTPFANCPPGVKEQLPDIVRVMELLLEKEEEMNMIENKK